MRGFLGERRVEVEEILVNSVECLAVITKFQLFWLWTTGPSIKALISFTRLVTVQSAMILDKPLGICRDWHLLQLLLVITLDSLSELCILGRQLCQALYSEQEALWCLFRVISFKFVLLVDHAILALKLHKVAPSRIFILCPHIWLATHRNVTIHVQERARRSLGMLSLTSRLLILILGILLAGIAWLPCSRIDW